MQVQPVWPGAHAAVSPGARHGMPLQQSLSCVQLWPYCEQAIMPASFTGTPESLTVPPSPGGGGGGGRIEPQVPLVEPGGTMQV